jgi:hypothetical protein
MLAEAFRNLARRTRVLFRVLFSRNIFLVAFPSVGLAYFRWRYGKLFRRIAARGGKFVLQVSYGGLGDHLIYASLPDLLFRKFGIETCISTASPFRSKDIRRLVWENNTHARFSDEQGRVLQIPRLRKYSNYNDVLLKMFPVAGAPSISIPYIPQLRADVAGKIVCDLTFGPSGALNGYDSESFREAVFRHLSEHGIISRAVFLEPEDPYPDRSILSFIRSRAGTVETLKVQGLFELADILYSAQERVLLYSGSASLSAALGKHATVLCRHMANRYFQYPVNTYIFI